MLKGFCDWMTLFLFVHTYWVLVVDASVCCTLAKRNFTASLKVNSQPDGTGDSIELLRSSD